MNNIINSGDKYYIYGDGVKVSQKLPAQAYTVCFDQMTGWWLEKAKEPIVGSDKIYGCLAKRVEKVFSTYKRVDKNLGVILSGAKGIGKSLFARVISKKAIENGLPVVFVNENIAGLSTFLASIDQRCLILFDEFDKVFYCSNKDEENKSCDQDSFLTLFDGIYASNKLFVITANDLNKLSEFLINRPGRFRYHIRFDYPNVDETKEFLSDKLDKKVFKREVENILRFISIVPLSYDCLTAIADELNNGETFESCLDILNIINVMNDRYYSGLIVYDSGETFRLDYVGNRNFLNKDEDYSECSTYFNSTQRSDYDQRIADVCFRNIDIRKYGIFKPDNTIIVPYSSGRGFSVVKNKKSKYGKKMTSSPKELILTSSDNTCCLSYRNVAF